MEYKCYLCSRKVKTNDLFATISTHIENGADEKDGGDIIETVLEEKICSWCANRFDYLQIIIKEGLERKEKERKSNKSRGKKK